MKEKIEINKMLNLSTAHLTERTRHLLDDCPDNLSVVVYDKPKYGWFVNVPDDLELEIEIDKDTCPQDLYNALLLAKENGCQWIMFDCDVEVIETEILENYAWVEDGKDL